MEPTPTEPDVVITAVELRALREAAAAAAAPVVAPAASVELVEKSETGWFKNEPIVATESFKQVLVGVMAVLTVFGIVELSNEQVGVILALFAALSSALAGYARSKVTPSSRVALTKSDVRTIEAARSQPS